MRFRDARNGSTIVAGLSIPLLSLGMARQAVGLRPSTACVVRRRVGGNWREHRRFNRLRPGDVLDVIPPVQDALPPLAGR